MKLKIRLISVSILVLLCWLLFIWSGQRPTEKEHSESVAGSTQRASVDFLSSLKVKLEQKQEDETFVDLFQSSSQQQRKYHLLLNILKNDVLIHGSALNYSSIWKNAADWVHGRQVVPTSAPDLGSVLKSLQTAKIVKADVCNKGTQLKASLVLEGGQEVFFKPKRYHIDEIVKGTPYAGFDRHNGEIVAFHLSRLLNLRYVPATVGRRIDVEFEIKPVATKKLLDTFVIVNNETTNCFYGQCYYCHPHNSVCPKESGFLEGAIILLLPEQYPLQRVRSPWQRTYRDNVLSTWETDPQYCETVRQRVRLRPRLLDLIDTAIFDYLIGNADRHHYEIFREMPNSAVLLIDNGKSFGNPYWDELTILAPLYQCCLVRRTTYDRLLLFSTAKNTLSEALKQLIATDPLDPLLSEANLKAVDRRLRTIITLVNMCFDDKNVNKVLQ